MWLASGISAARLAVLIREYDSCALTVHDRSGDVLSHNKYRHLLSPPQATAEIRAAGYVVSWWEQAEPGTYWAVLSIPPKPDFRGQGGWDKGAGEPPANMWALDPEAQAKYDRIGQQVAERNRLEALEARKPHRLELAPGIAYAVRGW